MEKTLFEDLLQSLKEAPASRHFEITLPDVTAVREQVGLSQREFARMIRVNIKTLQNWEQLPMVVIAIPPNGRQCLRQHDE